MLRYAKLCYVMLLQCYFELCNVMLGSCCADLLC